MTDGFSDARKKISIEDEIRIESYRIEMMQKDLTRARKALKKLKEDNIKLK